MRTLVLALLPALVFAAPAHAQSGAMTEVSVTVASYDLDLSTPAD